MTARGTLTIAIDGLWTAMELARLLHLAVRHYRLEQLILVAGRQRPALLEERLDPVILKYLAAFDWIAAPLMSARFNQSLERSEEFVREYGMADLRVEAIAYGSPGRIAFSGVAPIVERIAATFVGILEIHGPSSPLASDAQGRLAALEAMYAANLRAKAELMRRMQYSDAELHAIVSPSIEDLHFISNAVTQGKIVAVEKRARGR
jgi:hypothetical protein